MLFLQHHKLLPTYDSIPSPFHSKKKQSSPSKKLGCAGLWKLISIYEEECCLVKGERSQNKRMHSLGGEADRYRDFFLQGKNSPPKDGPVENKSPLLSSPHVRASTSPWDPRQGISSLNQRPHL